MRTSLIKPAILFTLAVALPPAGLVAASASIEACSATPAQVQAITAAGASELECIATAALNGGITDPLILGTMCGGLTIATIVNILDILLAGGTPVIVDGGVVAEAAAPTLASQALPPRLFNFTPMEKARLQIIKATAVALLQSGSAK